MAEFVLNAEVRRKTGKGDARRLRSSGAVPSVIYGKGIEPIHCYLNLRDMEKVLSEANRNSILKIAFNGKEKDREVILRDYQKNPLSQKYDHMDFQAIDLTQPLQVEVDIHLVGEPVGRKAGAVLTVQLKTLRIECLPAKIPPAVDVEVSHLNAGDSLHVSDITAGAYKIVSNPKLTICQMSLIKEEVAEVTAVATPDAAAPVAGAAPAAPAAEAKKEGK